MQELRRKSESKYDTMATSTEPMRLHLECQKIRAQAKIFGTSRIDVSISAFHRRVTRGSVSQPMATKIFFDPKRITKNNIKKTSSTSTKFTKNEHQNKYNIQNKNQTQSNQQTRETIKHRIQ